MMPMVRPGRWQVLPRAHGSSTPLETFSPPGCGRVSPRLPGKRQSLHNAMRLFRHYDELPAEFRGSVIALGNFDGVHRGHQVVIGEALRLARSSGAPAAVMTFDPHPRRLFRPDLPPFALTSLRMKARLIEALGVDFLYVQHFDAAFAGKSAESFIADVLIGGLNVSHVVVGADYAFGKGRGGSVEMLRACASEHAATGFEVTAVDLVADPDGGSSVYSSTAVRQALSIGDTATAGGILGHPWEIEGRVEHGDARGRTIGFPTANIRLGEYTRPAAGVYVVQAGIDRGGETEWIGGVANYGRRPTFDKTDDLLEVHLFDFSGDLYGQHLRVRFLHHLRPEQKFSGLEALTAQIRTDAEQARIILARGAVNHMV